MFVGFLHIFLLTILIFKGLTPQRLYKTFGIKGLRLKCYTLNVKIRYSGKSSGNETKRT
jgi:hypothetical protein